MSEKRILEEQYAAVQRAIPEPGINRAEVEAMLEEANAFSEGFMMYLTQATSAMARDILRKQYTYHPTINDTEFHERLLSVFRE